jgi:hypothetical protein
MRLNIQGILFLSLLRNIQIILMLNLQSDMIRKRRQDEMDQ